MTTANKPCPCGSGAAYFLCCGPLLSGQSQALTAEALMRSRYTAYVEQNDAYVMRTWHPSFRPAAFDPTTQPDWCGLTIVRAEQGRETDDEGVVEFVATALMGARLFKLHEVSRFVREEGQWLYVSGETVGDGERAATGGDKIGRNDPCPCNSGKKFKKCCGR